MKRKMANGTGYTTRSLVNSELVYTKIERWICNGDGPKCVDWVEMNEEEVRDKYRLAEEMAV